MPITIDGNNTPTAGGIGYGDGTELAFTSAGSSGQVLTSNGASAPAFAAIPTTNLATGVTGTLPIANGGTGTTSTTFANLTTNVTGTLPVANGGTGATTLTANNVLLGNGTSALQTVAPGTTGNVLTSNGTTWQSSAPAGGGSWVFINSTTASSSSTVDISGFSSTYDMHAIVFTGVYGEGGSVQLLIRLNCGSGFLGSNYSRTYVFSGVWNSNSGQDGIYIIQSYTSNSQNRISGIVYVPNASDTNVLKSCFGLGGTPGTPIISFSGGTNDTTSGVGALTGLRFLMSSGSVFAGTFRLYGIKNS